MRLSGQTVVLSNGSKVSSKNVRIASLSLARDYGARKVAGTFGIARVNGFEIPVSRGPRGYWYQRARGERYSAHASISSFSFDF